MRRHPRSIRIDWQVGQPTARYTDEKTMGDERWKAEITL